MKIVSQFFPNLLIASGSKRVSPEIIFSFDESVGEGDKIDRLLREVKAKEGW